MAKFVDGFVLVVPKSKVATYTKMAKWAAKLWRKHGALEVKECIGDDLNPDTGGYPFLNFTKLVKLKKDETVWFSYIVYKTRKHRDQVNRNVMNDPAMQSQDSEHMKDMPFDMKRMSYAGFRVEVDA